MLILEEKDGNETLCDPSQGRNKKVAYCENAGFEDF